MKDKASSTHKKVIAETRKGDREQGYVNYSALGNPQGLELLDSKGQHHTIAWKALKILWFVRDWDTDSPALAETPPQSRPRVEGLWIRLHFRDDTMMEGILVNDLLQIEPQGYLVAPPNSNGDSHTAFVPRAALKSAKVLSVIGAQGRRPARRRRTPAPGQTRLFDT